MIFLYTYIRIIHPKTFTPIVMDTKSDSLTNDDLRDLLKRCPAGTFEAAVAFRTEKDTTQIETIVLGLFLGTFIQRLTISITPVSLTNPVEALIIGSSLWTLLLRTLFTITTTQFMPITVPQTEATWSPALTYSVRQVTTLVRILHIYSQQKILLIM